MVALKKKKAGAKKSAGDAAAAEKAGSPTISPAGSPKVAPASPKVAPAPDTKGKDDPPAKAKKGPEPSPPPTEEEKAAAAEKVVDMIIKGLKEEPHCQDKGFAFIPKNYKMEFKGILGPYKHFVESCPKLRLVPGSNPAKYTVQLASGTKEELSDGVKPKWDIDLQKAWLCYCRAIPRGQRSPDEFVDAAKRIAQVGLIRDKPKKDKQKSAPGEEKNGAGEVAEKPAAKAKKRKREEDEAEDEPEGQDVAPPPTKKSKEKKKKKVSAGA